MPAGARPQPATLPRRAGARQNGRVHEMSVALSLVEAACEKASALGGVKVTSLHVRVGALSGVVKDALLFAFDVVAEGTPLSGSRLEIEEVPLTVRCRRCAEDRQLAGPPLVCPVCEALAPEVVAGRELELHALEVTENAAAHR